MLVLHRKKNQSIKIGDNIELSVLEVGGDWVKLAISAPKDISILRAELAEAVRANREAVDTASINVLKKVMKKEPEVKKDGQGL